MFVRIAPFCTTWFILRSNSAPSATCPLRRASPDLSLGPPLFFIGSVVKTCGSDENGRVASLAGHFLLFKCHFGQHEFHSFGSLAAALGRLSGDLLWQ